MGLHSSDFGRKIFNPTWLRTPWPGCWRGAATSEKELFVLRKPSLIDSSLHLPTFIGPSTLLLLSSQISCLCQSCLIKGALFYYLDFFFSPVPVLSSDNGPTAAPGQPGSSVGPRLFCLQAHSPWGTLLWKKKMVSPQGC